MNSFVSMLSLLRFLFSFSIIAFVIRFPIRFPILGIFLSLSCTEKKNGDGMPFFSPLADFHILAIWICVLNSIIPIYGFTISLILPDPQEPF